MRAAYPTLLPKGNHFSECFRPSRYDYDPTTKTRQGSLQHIKKVSVIQVDFRVRSALCQTIGCNSGGRGGEDATLKLATLLF